MTSRNHRGHSYRASVAAILVVTWLGGAIIGAPLPLAAQDAGYVNTENIRLNVRSGPGTGFAIVAKLDPGVSVEVLATSEDGLWMEVQSGAITGWALGELIALGAPAAGQGGPSANPTPAAQGPSFGPRLIPESVARALAGSAPAGIATDTTAAAPVATATPGFEFPVPTPQPGETAGTTGAPGTGVETAPVTAQAAQSPAPSVATAFTKPDRMNLRSGPGTNYGVVASVPAGTALEILALGPSDEWYQVKLEGQTEPAWLFAGLVDAAGPLEALARVAEADLPPAPEPAVAAQPVASSAAVVAAPPPSGGGYFGYGIQAHMLGGQAGSVMTAVSDMGFNWVKQQVQWKDYQPQAGAVGFGELGGIVSAAQSRGINVLFSVVNAPTWARESGYDGSVGGPPADPQTFANYVGRMAGQFCGTSLKAIEIWNEQNLHYEWGNKPLNPAEYMELLKPAYASIKANCPEMLVISGALTPAASNGTLALDDFAYLEGMYQNGLAAYSDGIGAHPSGYNVPASVGWEQACSVIQQTGNSFNGACDSPHHSWSFRSTMEGYRNIMTVYGDTNKRIWPTEFGWAAGGAFDPRYAYANDNGHDEQAAWTVEAYTMMKNWGWVGPAFLWNLNFRVVADGTEKAQWGIVGNDWQPLPAYNALKAMPK